jgi:hypothetical protein
LPQANDKEAAMRSMTTLGMSAIAALVLLAPSVPAAADHERRPVRVKAPYTTVEAGRRVRVSAPYTRVAVDSRRVTVRAPYVNLVVRW